jgi:hypothetical protein
MSYQFRCKSCGKEWNYPPPSPTAEEVRQREREQKRRQEYDLRVKQEQLNTQQEELRIQQEELRILKEKEETMARLEAHRKEQLELERLQKENLQQQKALLQLQHQEQERLEKELRLKEEKEREVRWKQETDLKFYMEILQPIGLPSNASDDVIRQKLTLLGMNIVGTQETTVHDGRAFREIYKEGPLKLVCFRHDEPGMKMDAGRRAAACNGCRKRANDGYLGDW